MLNHRLINYKISPLSAIAISLTTISLLACPLPILAQLEEPQLTPLEIPVEDPLLPSIPRPLTPLEQRKLRQELEQLNLEAQAEFDQGNREGAFEIWYRELRVRRILGRLEEINALGRVGGIAWNNTLTEQVQIISKRLVALQKLSEKEDPLSPELLMALADAYEKLHALDDSLNIYNQVLNNARQMQDKMAEEKALKRLGELYLAKFDYPQAAPIYEELLERAQTTSNTLEEGVYLQILAEIYTRSLKPENATKIKEKLAENYLYNQQLELIPPLKVSIGKDYEALDQPEMASQNYQEAYSLAWNLQLFGAAGEALTQLGKLYQSYDQDNYALQIYQNLIQVEQLSYNYYGLMKTYERIGQIYLENQQYQQALAFFEQGLVLAQSLNHKQDDFVSYISQVNQKMQGEDQEVIPDDLNLSDPELIIEPGENQEFQFPPSR